MASSVLYIAKKNITFNVLPVVSLSGSNSAVQLRIEVTSANGKLFEFLTLNSSFFLSTSSSTSVFFSLPSVFSFFKNFINNRMRWLNGGFFHEFIIRGIGYRYKFHRAIGRSSLFFKIGYGHKVLFPLSSQVEFRNNKRYDFIVAGVNKAAVKNMAEAIRSIKPTDPYKGKGIKYYHTPLKLKVGKVR